jgi:hypothetical protein
MQTQNFKTATNESAEQGENTPESRICITDGLARLEFIVELFACPQGEAMVLNWMRAHTNYDGGYWNFYKIQEGITAHTGPYMDVTTSATGYIAPDSNELFSVRIPGNFFDAQMSADAVGIVATLFVLNQLSWQVSEMGERYAPVCQKLIDAQDALKDFLDVISHPESGLIYRAID